MEKLHELSERERHAAERKLQQLTQRLSITLSELNDERQMGTALRSNQNEWQQRFAKLEAKHVQHRKEKEQEIADLKEQIRDLMFFIDAGRAIADSADKEDIAGGTVTVGPPAGTAESKQRRGRKKKP